MKRKNRMMLIDSGYGSVIMKVVFQAQIICWGQNQQAKQIYYVKNR